MFEKDKKRALRRFHLQRMKRKATRVYYFCSPDRAIKYANHLKTCSCVCCGNQRRFYGSPVRELKQKDVDSFDLSDYDRSEQ